MKLLQSTGTGECEYCDQLWEVTTGSSCRLSDSLQVDELLTFDYEVLQIMTMIITA